MQTYLISLTLIQKQVSGNILNFVVAIAFLVQMFQISRHFAAKNKKL